MANQRHQPPFLPRLAGMITGAFAEAFQEMAKELRRHAGDRFDQTLNELEIKAVKSVENAAIDELPEDQQLKLVEQTRYIIRGAFTDARAARAPNPIRKPDVDG